MNLISLFKENRMKIASLFAVTGDFLLGLAGGVNIFNYRLAVTPADFMLVAASAMFLCAHGVMLLWGKGGRASSVTAKTLAKQTSILLRPLFPWRYPYDTGCILWAGGGALILLAGLTSSSLNFTLTGFVFFLASVLGWLWPQEKPIFGLRLLQFTAVLYSFGSFNMIAAAFAMGNGLLLATGCTWLCCNIIYGTVRKVNQSVFTQATDGGAAS